MQLDASSRGQLDVKVGPPTATTLLYAWEDGEKGKIGWLTGRYQGRSMLPV